MIPQLEIQADADVLDKIVRQMRRSPGLMATAYKRQLRNTKRSALNRLRNTAPPAPSYPIRWANARQRRAFFATNGFGRGIPTQRTGDLLDSYNLTVDNSRDGGALVLENDAAHAVYVIGNQQQPMHADTGWELISDSAERVQTQLTEDLIDTWYTVADPFAGVPL